MEEEEGGWWRLKKGSPHWNLPKKVAAIKQVAARSNLY